MRTATIQEAKDDLQRLIAAVRSGETVLITDDGTAVAELQPAIQQIQQAAEQRTKPNQPKLSDLINVGASPPPNLERFPADSVSSGALDALLEERREGW